MGKFVPVQIIGLLIGAGLSMEIAVRPAQAQVSDQQVGALVEALRQAAPPGGKNDGYYSEWQVKPENIPRWSKRCTGKALSPTQFEASATAARGVITCVIRDVLQDEYRASKNVELTAVRRVAAWWMTGDPSRYQNTDLAPYLQKVVGFYQQQRPSTVTPAATTDKTTTQVTTPNRSVAYDRYMQAGYTADKKGDHQQALLYFRRALDERPNDTYAQQAIGNQQRYLQRSQAASPTAKPTATKPSPTATQPSPDSAKPAPTATNSSRSNLEKQQAVELVNRWLKAKQQIFAPPFDLELINQLTTGELYTALMKPGGMIVWLRNNQAHYHFGVQKVESVEKFVAESDKATIELKITEDRTLYRNGAVDPSRTTFDTKTIRYSLESVGNTWKISDYKSTDGSLLEREVLGTGT